MRNLVIKEIEYKNLGRCLSISNGVIEIVSTLDVGPRIVRFAFCGEENMLGDNAPMIKENIFGDDFHLIGGHRLWHAPEELPRTYMPDNHEVQYKKIENGVTLIQKEEKWVQVQKEIDIVVIDDNEVKLTHRIHNMNAWPIELALWGITIMNKGGLGVLPQSNKDTAFLPNRSFVFWPYSKPNDKRVTYGEKYLMLKHDEKIKDSFKIGIKDDKEWAAYFNLNNLFIKTFKTFEDGNYPDMGCSCESYMDGDVLEIETLSPFYTIKPKEYKEHIENWKLIKDVILKEEIEEEIEKVMINFIK